MPDASERKAQQYYDDFSDSYERERDSDYHRMVDDLELEVAAQFAEGARVLELGSGTGLIHNRTYSFKVLTHVEDVDTAIRRRYEDSFNENWICSSSAGFECSRRSLPFMVYQFSEPD